MPHCVVEYSSDLEQANNITVLMQMIQDVMANSELFDIKTIKIRAIPISTYLIGGKVIPFIHSTVRILTGRTDQQKQLLSQKILETISNEFIAIDNITVDIIEINPNTYGKKKKL